MDDFTRLLNGATQYPRNLARKNTIDHSLDSYFAKINLHQKALFTSERGADLHFRELRSDGEGLST